MCPIVLGDDVMHINEWAGLNVKIWKCSYFDPVLFHMYSNWYNYVVS